MEGVGSVDASHGRAAGGHVRMPSTLLLMFVLQAALGVRLLAAAEGRGDGARWEGSGEWVRASVRAHFAKMMSTASSQLLAGNTLELQARPGLRRRDGTRGCGCCCCCGMSAHPAHTPPIQPHNSSPARRPHLPSPAALQEAHGTVWVRLWTMTHNFADWASRNGLQATPHSVDIACRCPRVDPSSMTRRLALCPGCPSMFLTASK